MNNDYTSATLGELLSHNDATIVRNATSILKRLQGSINRLKKHCWCFKSIEDYQKKLRKTGKAYDYVVIGDIIYTMDEYDMGGRCITYGNLRHKKKLEVTTQDRYKLGFNDATINEYELYSWRNDISYLD